MKTFLAVIILALLASGFQCSNFAQEAPFNRGINLTGWFQAGNVRQIQFNRYSKKDFQDIKGLGCDVIRLPINLHYMTNGKPDYTIDPLFYELLDEVVNWAEELEIFLIIDNHTFDPLADTDPGIGAILEKVWLQMAGHYKGRSQFVLYEILNEPHGIADALWNSIQQGVIGKIRSVDTRHTIVVGPASWNSYNNLANLPRYEDNNLIYTFHFYDPFLFTHQGATWVDPSMAPLANIPFPYKADSMPPLPASLTNTWVGDNYRSYSGDGTVKKVKELIDIAARFRDERKVPVFCGEFGVYIPNSLNHHRVYWYEVVRKYLEEKNIAWTSWDYHGGFGLFKEGGNDLFEHDLNTGILKALGFNVPPQTNYIVRADSTGSVIYDDFPGEHLFESSWNNGIIDYYSKNQPNNGKYCILWTGAVQYNTIGLDYKPNRDFSDLVKDGYALDLMIRGDTPGMSFQFRFMDSKTDTADDYPWRMGVKIDEQLAPWDRRWHHLHIPLSRFTEQGAWYNGWHNPEGKFDWKAIDRLELVTEYGSLGPARFWFDNIHITELDTARINDTTAFKDVSGIFAGRWKSAEVRIWPNPVLNYVNIETMSDESMDYQLIDSYGRVLMLSGFFRNTGVDMARFPPGTYYLRVICKGQVIKAQALSKWHSS